MPLLRTLPNLPKSFEVVLTESRILTRWEPPKASATFRRHPPARELHRFLSRHCKFFGEAHSQGTPSIPLLFPQRPFITTRLTLYLLATSCTNGTYHTIHPLVRNDADCGLSPAAMPLPLEIARPDSVAPLVKIYEGPSASRRITECQINHTTRDS